MFCRDRAFLLPVAFVANQDLVDSFRGVLFDVGEPGPYVYHRLEDTPVNNLQYHTVEALLIRHIVHQQNTHGAPVICRRDRPEAFLARGVPYLKFHPLAVQVDGADFEIYADGGDEAGGEAVFGETQQTT